MNLETNFPTEYNSEGLKKAREYRGISLKETAALIGITAGTLGSYEKGKSFPSLPILESLSYIYQIPIHILISPDALENFTVQPDADQLQQLIQVRQSIQTALLQMAFEESGLSQKALATAAGINRSKVKRYLEGDAIPVDDLKKITDALGIEFSQFIDNESQIGLWQVSQKGYEKFSELPENIKQFLFETNNWNFIKTGYTLRSLDPGEIEAIIHSLGKLRDTLSHQN
jgi:transcriptional regulator with XRE-family HTH domain